MTGFLLVKDSSVHRGRYKTIEGNKMHLVDFHVSVAMFKKIKKKLSDIKPCWTSNATIKTETE